MAAGCQRTVYVCDDGKDKFKRRMCQRMGREVIATPLPRHRPLATIPDRCLLAGQRICSTFQAWSQTSQAMQGAFVLGCPDIRHRPWLTQVQYISGRTRPSGETNGKSGNLNNACRQIYPAGCKIPDHEVICVMDADQVRRRRRHCFCAGPLRPLLYNLSPSWCVSVT